MNFSDRLNRHFFGQNPTSPTSFAVANGRVWLDAAQDTVNARHRISRSSLRVLTMLLELTHDMIRTGQLKPKLYQHCCVLMGLPLFFPGQWGETWARETHHQATNILGSEAKQNYLAALAQDVTYVGSPSDQPQQVFERWLENQRKETLEPLLAHTKSLFQGLLDIEEFQSEEDPIFTNSRLVAQRLGLSPSLVLAFEKVSSLLLLCKDHSDSMRLVFSVTDYSALAVWKTLADMTDVPAKDLQALFEAGSPLVTSGLFCCGDQRLSAVASGGDFIREFVNEPLYWPLCSAYCNPMDLGAVYLTKTPEESIPLDLEEFSYLAEMKDALVQAMRSKKPMRVLLWGPSGTGKTSLCHALARHTDRLCIMGKTTTRFSKNDDKGSERLFNMSLARNMAPIVSDHALLVVDECEQIICDKNKKAEVNQYLDQLVIPEIWIANDLHDVHEAFLRRFDLVVHVGKIPVVQRQRLALAIFKDVNLSARVAQACHTPAALRQAHLWWSLSPKQGWVAVASQLAQGQKAKRATSGVGSNTQWAPEVVTANSQGRGLDQVIGYEITKRRARSLTSILAHPERFQAMRAKVPRGLLLVGLPGTGKTYLAQCLANELSVPMVMAASADLARAPERIGEVFAEARRLAPCLVFLDEIDVLGQTPISPQGVVDTQKQIILNRLLVELNGFDALDGVFVIGATHRPKLLDEALTRSGRLGAPLQLGLPTFQERESLWWHYLSNHPHAIESVSRLAQASGGMTPADIAQAANQAALEAALQNEEQLTLSLVEEALDEAFWGPPSDNAANNKKERQRTAIHEAGHIMMTWKNGLEVNRATIRPRAQFYGAIEVSREDGWSGYSGHADVAAEVQINLGGLLAEQLIFSGAHGAGVKQDLEATQAILRASFTQWGMGQSLPNHAMPDHVPMSDGLRHRVEVEEQQWVDTHFKEGQAWLALHRSVLEALAQTLLVEKDLSKEMLAQWKAHHFPDEDHSLSVPTVGFPNISAGLSITLHQDVLPTEK